MPLLIKSHETNKRVQTQRQQPGMQTSDSAENFSSIGATLQLASKHEKVSGCKTGGGSSNVAPSRNGYDEPLDSGR